jgi:hypothetical protein
MHRGRKASPLNSSSIGPSIASCLLPLRRSTVCVDICQVRKIPIEPQVFTFTMSHRKWGRLGSYKTATPYEPRQTHSEEDIADWRSGRFASQYCPQSQKSLYSRTADVANSVQSSANRNPAPTYECYSAKVATADFYFMRMLSRVAGLSAAMRGGSDSSCCLWGDQY